jgi:hypothetical protein
MDSRILVACAFAAAALSNGPSQARTFGGFECEQDCSSLAAGYRWAEDHDIEDAKDCPPGGSRAFYEGCLVFFRDSDRGAALDDAGRPIEETGSIKERDK